MTQMTSVHIKPCNIGQSEAHNQRTKAYLDHINAEKLYIRKDLIPENQSWTSNLQGNMTLQQYYDAIGRMVKEKTGRAMQTKERERVNKKTGMVTKIAGCTPLREGVVVCKARHYHGTVEAFCCPLPTAFRHYSYSNPYSP